MLDLQGLLSSKADLSVGNIMLSLVIGFILSLILKWHFHKFGSSFSNKQEFSVIFPFLVLIVTLIIAVVKSSLALSLGLVGALSIVRFRTPIKEPEELTYIFMAIAIGLGLGANQIMITVSASLLIFILMAIIKFPYRRVNQNLYLSINQTSGKKMLPLKDISNMIGENVSKCDLRRVDSEQNAQQVVYYVETKDVEKVYALVNSLKKKIPEASVSLIDQHRIPGV